MTGNMGDEVMDDSQLGRCLPRPDYDEAIPYYSALLVQESPFSRLMSIGNSIRGDPFNSRRYTLAYPMV